MTEILLSELTNGTATGEGIFDTLMKATKAHLELEFAKGRIKGPEYSEVYLGALDNVMSNSMQFLVQKKAVGLQADLLSQQILLAQIEVTKASKAVELMHAQLQNTIIEGQILLANKERISAEILHITAQTGVANQQKINMAAELPKIIAEVSHMESQAELTAQQVVNLAAQLPKIIAEVAEMESRAKMTAQQVLNLGAEALNIPKQGLMITAQTAQATQQTANMVSEQLRIVAQTDLVTQQKANAIIEGNVLTAQACKLQAEFNLTVNTNTKVTGEIALLAQKTATEKAQVMSMGVDDDSVIGKQKKLYQAQTDGFARDAEQKAAKLLVDTWSARRMSDESTVVDEVNMLNDATVGRVVNKVLSGVNA